MSIRKQYLTFCVAVLFLASVVALGFLRGAAVQESSDIPVLSSAVRTATTTSSDFRSTGKGVRVYLNVTAASGTGGLQVQIQGLDPVTATYFNLNATPTAIIATGFKIYDLYPGIGAAAGDVTQTQSQFLPSVWRVKVTHGDGSNYTYSVNAFVSQ